MAEEMPKSLVAAVKWLHAREGIIDLGDPSKVLLLCYLKPARKKTLVQGLDLLALVRGLYLEEQDLINGGTRPRAGLRVVKDDE